VAVYSFGLDTLRTTLGQIRAAGRFIHIQREESERWIVHNEYGDKGSTELLGVINYVLRFPKLYHA
jgi:hypothetical protein